MSMFNDAVEKVKGFLVEDACYLAEFGPEQGTAELRKMGGWRRVVCEHLRAAGVVDPSDELVRELRTFAQVEAPRRINRLESIHRDATNRMVAATCCR